jgi:Icc-related predicted phosphoesterase
MSQKPFKVFYVTDIHGSEICWRKFLNAGTFYQADVVIVGGDITGKAMVPIIRSGRPVGARCASPGAASAR